MDNNVSFVFKGSTHEEDFDFIAYSFYMFRTQLKPDHLGYFNRKDIFGWFGRIFSFPKPQAKIILRIWRDREWVVFKNRGIKVLEGLDE